MPDKLNAVSHIGNLISEMGFRMLGEQELKQLGAAHLARLLLQALRTVENGSVDKLRERGHPDVRTGHIPVFSQLGGGPLRITDVATRAGMTRQMMGRLVHELQQIGYVHSNSDPADQRAVIVELTELGWQFCHDAQDVMRDLEQEYAQRLGAEDLALLRSALIRLAAQN